MASIGLIEVKGGKGKVSEAKFVAAEVRDRADAIEAALKAVLDLTGLEVRFYACDKFKKIGDKGQVAALVNDIVEGADSKTLHIALSSDRAALRANDMAIADGAVIIAAQFVSLVSGLDNDVRAGFGWVPAAAGLAAAHPLLKDAMMKAPAGQREIPFTERYIVIALKDSMSVTMLASAALKSNPIFRRLIKAREAMAAEPVALPVAPAGLADAVRAALAKADAAPAAAAA